MTPTTKLEYKLAHFRKRPVLVRVLFKRVADEWIPKTLGHIYLEHATAKRIFAFKRRVLTRKNSQMSRSMRQALRIPQS